MERHAAAVAINEGKMNEFKKKLGEIWSDLTAWLDKNQVGNFSIWNAENIYMDIDTGRRHAINVSQFWNRS